MTEQECREVYDQLAKMLSENKLDWVIEQVAEEILFGKTDEREVQPLKKIDSKKPDLFQEASEEHFLPKGPRTKFPVTSEYKEGEKLELLIKAVEQVIVNAPKMQAGTFEALTEFQPDLNTITFYDEEVGEPQFSISRNQINQHLDRSAILGELLNRLREEI